MFLRKNRCWGEWEPKISLICARKRRGPCSYWARLRLMGFSERITQMCSILMKMLYRLGRLFWPKLRAASWRVSFSSTPIKNLPELLSFYAQFFSHNRSCDLLNWLVQGRNRGNIGGASHSLNGFSLTG